MVHIGTEGSVLANENKFTTASKFVTKTSSLPTDLKHIPNEVTLHKCFFPLHLPRMNAVSKSDTNVSNRQQNLYAFGKKKKLGFPYIVACGN